MSSIGRSEMRRSYDVMSCYEFRKVEGASPENEYHSMAAAKFMHEMLSVRCGVLSC